MPKCICDNNNKCWDEIFFGVRVLSPEECIGMFKSDIEDNIFVIANKFHYKEIEKQLISGTISREVII